MLLEIENNLPICKESLLACDGKRDKIMAGEKQGMKG
jgi:hypothetical protein